MPYGSPGDNPISDIVIHKINVFGQEIDDLIREVYPLNKPTVSKLIERKYMHDITDEELKKQLEALK